MSLEETLDELSKAHGAPALAAAFRRLQVAIKLQRRAASRGLGALAETYRVAVHLWDSEKADGVPLKERVAHLEKTLRAAWPQTREKHFLCVNCSDYGLEIHTCDGERATCRRKDGHLAHEYGKPCWCSVGARFKPKAKPSPEDFSAAGKTVTKPTRFGR